MDSSDFSSALKSLEDRSDSLSSWLIVFTFVVVLGLIVEYFGSFVKLSKLLELRLRPFHLFKPDKRKRAVTLARALIGGVLVTGGVAGEFWIETRESKVETKLRDKNHSAQAQLERDASEAKRDAGVSNLAAAKATERAALVNTKAEGLKVDLDTSKREQARLVLAAEELRKENIAAAERLEAEKRERLKAEEYLAPRDIGEQYSFGQALSKFKGMTAIIDVTPDSECHRLGETLKFSLAGIAQWKVEENPPSEDSWLPGGIVIEYQPVFLENKEDASEAAGKALEGMLNDRKISAQAMPRLGLPPNTLHVTIGLKPSPGEVKALKTMREKMEEVLGLRKPSPN